LATPKIGLPLIDGNMTADVPRDMNALADAVDAATDSAATPNKIVLRDAAGRFKAVAPASADDVVIKSTLDTAVAAKLDKAGGAMTGNLFAPNVPNRTTADITYYVRPDGNDNNDGLSNTAGGAFKTITKAISIIPHIVNHNFTINVADGTYNEVVTLEGKNGSGLCSLVGNPATPANVKVNSMILRRCTIAVVLNGFESTTTTDNGFTFNRVVGAFVSNLRCVTVSASFGGILIQFSTATLTTSTFSNRSRGLDVQAASIVASENNSGTGNTTGLYAIQASKIGKNGTQPAGTTSESSAGGAQIL
jgi:hypothetical protein